MPGTKSSALLTTPAWKSAIVVCPHWLAPTWVWLPAGPPVRSSAPAPSPTRTERPRLALLAPLLMLNGSTPQLMRVPVAFGPL
ncbi:hypothetical protein D3C86_1116680 [compost metagenome]